MCVLVTFDINLPVMENILHDHHESGVIKYAWTSTIWGIYKYDSCIANKVWPKGILLEEKVLLFFHKNNCDIVLLSHFFLLMIMSLASLKWI